MTNGLGTSVSREADFECFDKLPKQFRDALNEASIPFSALSLRRMFWRYDADESLPMVKQIMQQKERDACRNTWGADHPQNKC